MVVTGSRYVLLKKFKNKSEGGEPEVQGALYGLYWFGLRREIGMNANGWHLEHDTGLRNQIV
jgi:hypothetical protein